MWGSQGLRAAIRVLKDAPSPHCPGRHPFKGLEAEGQDRFISFLGLSLPTDWGSPKDRHARRHSSGQTPDTWGSGLWPLRGSRGPWLPPPAPGGPGGLCLHTTCSLCLGVLSALVRTLAAGFRAH